jgi:hypothetical protein
MGALTLEKVSAVGSQNAERNRARIQAGKSVLALRDTPLIEGDSALVIAAGPSLHRRDVARLLKEVCFAGVVVATESALSYCLRHEIVPDLVVTLDPHADRIVRWFGDPSLTPEHLERDTYFSRQDMDPGFTRDELRFNQELLHLVDRYGPKIRIAAASSASQAVVDRVHAADMEVYWWNPFYDDYERSDSLTRRLYESNGLPCLNAGGNVGSACWVIAHTVLRKKKIGLLGVDFSYYPDTPYERTQYYHELVRLVGQDRLDEVFVRIYNPYIGHEFYTDPAYLWYRDSFLEMAQAAPCQTFNCTEGGILFGKGLTFTSLKSFLESEERRPETG